MKWFDNNSKKIEQQLKNRDKVLFRIIPFDSLLQILNEKKNWLVRTSMWEDSYENFMLKEHFQKDGLPLSLEHMSNQWFGQCWTTRMSSDAMWRIYSPDKKGVRIKTTIGQLCDSAKLYQGDGQFMIGKVEYFAQSRIQKDLIDGSPYDIDSLVDLMISSFFVKRNSFSHESEYRIIYYCGSQSNDYGKDAVFLNISPLDFISNIYFDPRADSTYVERCKQILTKAFNYPAERIYKSTLYNFKPSTVIIIDK